MFVGWMDDKGMGDGTVPIPAGVCLTDHGSGSVTVYDLLDIFHQIRARIYKCLYYTFV